MGSLQKRILEGLLEAGVRASTTCSFDVYVKQHAPRMMRNFRGSKRLRKKTALKYLRLRWAYSRLGIFIR